MKDEKTKLLIIYQDHDHVWINVIMHQEDEIQRLHEITRRLGNSKADITHLKIANKRVNLPTILSTSSILTSPQ